MINKKLKKKINEFKDDEMNIIEDDITKIRNRPGMYGGYDKEKGVLHLCKELTDNSLDECTKEDTPGDKVELEISKDQLIVKDNGRGIDTKLLRKIFETLNAGSNMVRAHGMTAGENGAGSTLLCALSSYLELIDKRPQEKKLLRLVYKEGKLVEENLEKYTGEEHGMTAIFKPSKIILGYDQIPVDDLINWIEDFRYTVPRKVDIEYTYKKKTHKIEHKELHQYFDEVIPADMHMSPAHTCSATGHLTEIVKGEQVERTFNIECSYMYASPNYKEDDVRKSWMNRIFNGNNGMHMNGCINGLVKYLTEKVIQKKASLKDEDLKKDILAHLQVVVRCECDHSFMFNAQEKGYVFQRDLLGPITDAIYEALSKDNRMADFVEIVIQNNRVRKAGEQARNINKETRTTGNWDKPSNFISCSGDSKRPLEIFICEGKSAGGGIRAARDPKTQAIYLLQGKPLNVLEESVERVLKSRVWRDLIKVLGCGFGPTFNIKKLKYHKIFIATDADIDGFDIRFLVAMFFYKFMPQVIEEGMLYFVESPLYKLEYSSPKRVTYVSDKSEYINACLDNIENLEIEFTGLSDLEAV